MPRQTRFLYERFPWRPRTITWFKISTVQRQHHSNINIARVCVRSSFCQQSEDIVAGPHNSRGLFEGSALVWRLGLEPGLGQA